MSAKRGEACPRSFGGSRSPRASWSWCRWCSSLPGVGSLDGTGDVLLGGAVDGPSDCIPTGFFGPNQAPPCPPDGKNPFRPFDQADWRYVDRVASWATTEPANDYSSLALLAFVQLAAQD